jgi:hypothetical protein
MMTPFPVLRNVVSPYHRSTLMLLHNTEQKVPHKSEKMLAVPLRTAQEDG